ncbi:hypothetical protein IFM89_000054 [Coptis chinensis]|uniref:Uncharacterized protein n=1 Tax=Coptis chinensis TaxID=261450 RepID=A0A835IFN1_9MAGN|nr:hypothetical protein IFM89_000054 [Coptis chinensis]
MELQSTYYFHFPSINKPTNHIKWTTPKLELNRRKKTSYSYPNFILNASSSDKSNANGHLRNLDKPEPFGGKSGSVSFYGLTHQVIEEGQLVSAPFKDGKSSILWVLAPFAFISSLILPQFFLTNAIDSLIKDEILAEIVASFSSEAMFYFGLAAFLLIADHVQRPYLQFTPKRWGLITGLNGYLSSAFFTMGFKVRLDKRGSSCWPIVPIIFEADYVNEGAPSSPQLLERSGALVAMLVSFQVLGVVCLWSLMTFLLRLFPSRPVADKY